MVESDMNSIFEMDLKKLACEHINCTELIMDCVQWWFFFMNLQVLRTWDWLNNCQLLHHGISKSLNCNSVLQPLMG